nr:caspase family protein [Streptomyces niveoruber]
MRTDPGAPDGRDRRFRALLVGVDGYVDPAFRSMPFITTELRVLAETLENAGYQEAAVLEAGDLHGQAIEDEIERFVRKAAPGDHLLLLLSGHGFHTDGSDYLVTGPARYDSLRFRDHCLRIEFGSFLMNSDAAQLVVAVDACRDPFETFTKSVGDTLSYGKGSTGYEDTDDPGRPRYAHVYACARYGTAGYGREPGPAAGERTGAGDDPGGFSYFTRALTELAGDRTAPGALAALEPVLDDRLRAIAAGDRGHSDQCVQVTYATGEDGLLLFPCHDSRTGRPVGEHPWQKAALDHEAWLRVRAGNLTEEEKGRAVAQVRDGVARLVGLWGHETDTSDAWLAAHGDIWRPSGCEQRMGLCVGTVLRGAPALSLTEAALLVLGPYLYTAFGTRLAHLAGPLRPWTLADGPPAEESCGFATRGAFERYGNGHLALQDRERRARERGDEDGARAVAWWLARQWLLRLPGTRDAVRRSGLAGLENLPGGPEFEPELVRQVLSPARLGRLAGLIGLDLERAGTEEPDTVAAQLAAEHTVDWDRVGTLLTVAHHMAVDPVLLPPLVAEHLGISKPVDGAAFRETLRRLAWQPDGARRVLSAECPHQAVELALREHTETLDRTVRAVLARSDDARPAVRGIPAGFGSGKVVPGLRPDGRPLYEAADVRFRLDGDRVRDLLMGEQLYRDRTLALRELYQNALDACRYRRARTELWNRRNPGERDDWKGEIVFTQGRENGRPYIECHDNGIGMGHHELRRLFAFAGSRFVEQREFLDEWAQWDAEGIAFHPNSRFGVGVLSYFMLADEIRVTTTRLGRDLRAGERLTVHIDGPGALFSVRSDRSALRAGTRVRLYLRDSEDTVSCGEVLRRTLWVSEFAVRVEEEGEEGLSWAPGELSPYVRSGRPSEEPQRMRGEPVPAQYAGDGVWWLSGQGAVLADGLWAGVPRFGCVVDLTGEHAPRLSLDRTTILDDHEEYLTGLLTEKIPVLFAEGGRVLSLEWLDALTVGEWVGPNRALRRTEPTAVRQGLLADRIADQAVARGHRFSFRTDEGADVSVDTAAVGCCPADRWLVERFGKPARPHVVTTEYSAFTEWRARVWAAADPGCGVLPRSDAFRDARPTDDQILQSVDAGDAGVPLGMLLGAAHETGLPLAYVSERLRLMGVRTPDRTILERLREAERRDPDVPDLLRKVLSRDRDGVGPWLGPQDEVSVDHLRLGGGDPRALARLVRTLGFRVPDDDEFDRPRRTGDAWPPRPEDLPRLVLREGLEYDGADLARDRPVPLAHLVIAAKAFPGQADRIAATLVAAGHRLPEGAVPEHADGTDLALLAWEHDGRPPRYPVSDAAVPLYRLLAVARRREIGPETLVERARMLGLRPPELPPPAERELYTRLAEDLATRIAGGLGPLVPVHVLLDIAWEYGMSDHETARRLRLLGADVHRLEDHPARPENYSDLILMSQDLDGTDPWLDPAHQVPWHHVLRAEVERKTPQTEVIERLTRHGYDVAPEPPPGDWMRGDDRELIRAVGNHREPHGAGTGVPLTTVLHTAHTLRRTPTDIARRLRQLGHTLPGDLEFTDPATR